MSLLTDDDKLGIAETVVHMDFTESFTDCINLVCDLAEAATIRALAGVSGEPVAWARRDDEGQEFDMVFLDKAECQSYLDDDEYPEGLQTAAQLAAVRVQTLEEAADISEQSFAGDDGVVIAWRIRALIGGER